MSKPKMLHGKTLTAKARAVADHADKLGTSATLGDMWRELLEELPAGAKKGDRFVEASVTFADWESWTGEKEAKSTLQFIFAKYADRFAIFVEGWEAATAGGSK